MARRAAKVDANQPEIVAALRGAGASVEHLHAVGGGCPDILVGHLGVNYLMEIKDGSKPPSKQKLTLDQEKWHPAWRGSVHIVKSIEDALGVIGVGIIPHRGTIND